MENNLDFYACENILKKIPSINGVIDVGSHEGNFSKHLINSFKDLNLILIEPLPEKCEILRNNFKSAEIYECAISSSEGIHDLYVPENSKTWSALYNRDVFEQLDKLKLIKTIPVNVSRLDNILKKSESFSKISNWYLKIDSEGYETEVIESLGDLISDSKISAGQFEYGGTWQERGLKINDMLVVLRSNNFEVYGYRNGFYRLPSYLADNYHYNDFFFVKNNFGSICE